MTTIVQQVAVPYALTDHAADRAIASVTVDGDCAIDSFVLKDGEVSLDENDNIVVTLTGDVSGTVEIPDNVGAVTIDLNGHDMVGDGGRDGARPSQDTGEDGRRFGL